MCDFLLIHTFGKCVQVPLSLFIYMKKIKQLSTIIIHNKYDITCCRFGKNRKKHVMIKLPFTFTKYII